MRNLAENDILLVEEYRLVKYHCVAIFWPTSHEVVTIDDTYCILYECDSSINSAWNSIDCVQAAVKSIIMI